MCDFRHSSSCQKTEGTDVAHSDTLAQAVSCWSTFPPQIGLYSRRPPRLNYIFIINFFTVQMGFLVIDGFRTLSAPSLRHGVDVRAQGHGGRAASPVVRADRVSADRYPRNLLSLVVFIVKGIATWHGLPTCRPKSLLKDLPPPQIIAEGWGHKEERLLTQGLGAATAGAVPTEGWHALPG